MAHSADESVVADIVVSSDGMADFLFLGKKIPDDEQRGQTARGSGAEQLRPLRGASTSTKIHCIWIAASAQLGSSMDESLPDCLKAYAITLRATGARNAKLY